MKKILYLEHSQADLNAYNIYKGLCELVGEENVIDFPYKKIYRAEIDVFDSPYLNLLRSDYQNNRNLPYGIPPFAPGEDIISGWPDVRVPDPEKPWSFGYFIPHELNYQGGYPLVGLSTKGRDLSEHDIVTMLRNGEFCFIVLSSSHRVNTIALARLRDHLGGLNKLPPIIYTDHGERDELNEHWAHVFNPTIIFKCLLTETIRDGLTRKYGWHHVHPLPNSNFMLGQDFNFHFKNNTNYGEVPKQYDVFHQFMSQVNREHIVDIMNKYCTDRNLQTYPGTSEYFKYLQIMNESKIVVTHHGVCRETLRYWDISMFPTMMICDETMGCIHPYPFEDGKTAVFYKDQTASTELPDKCDFYLRNDSERERITRAGMEHLRKFHTNKERARYFLDIAKRYNIETPVY